MEGKKACFVLSCLVLACLLSIILIQGNSGERTENDGYQATPVSLHPADAPGSSDQTGDEWPMFHGALNHTGTGTTVPVNGKGPAWSYPVPDISGSPVVASGRVYIGSGDYNVYCLNASTGVKMWNYTTTGGISSAPAVAGGCLYVGSYSELYCLNATTGAFLWSSGAYSLGMSSPAVAGGRVYIGTWYGLACMNASNGEYFWTFGAGSKIFDSSPAVAGGRVYVGDQNNQTYCLNATSGALEWSHAMGNGVDSSPAVAGGRLYVGCWDGNIYCLNATSGSSLWNYTTVGSVESSPAVCGRLVYAGSDDGNIYCFNAITGAPVWTYPTDSPVGSSPAIASGFVYIGSDEEFYCLNASNGDLAWSFETSLEAPTSPAVAEGYVFTGSDNSEVYCLPMVSCFPPAAPQGLHASAPGYPPEVMLSWQAPSDDGYSPVTGYKIYRGISQDDAVCVATVGDVTTWSDPSTKGMNGSYYYAVSALNAAGEGPLSLGTTIAMSSAGTRTSIIMGYPVALLMGILAVAGAVVVVGDRRRLSVT